ncbi:MAG: flagellar biosynthetic protein FliR [Sediminispirochaetaceae bacterium]
MNLDLMIENGQLLLILFARIFALLSVAPLLSSSSIPSIARVGLALFTSFAVFPWVYEAGYPVPAEGLSYGLILVGEALIGIILGFTLNLIYTAFILAGQYFSFQMGFGASQVYDPMAQVQIPIMGQFLNLIAMLVFVINGGFQKLFLIGVLRSFETTQASELAMRRGDMMEMIASSIGLMFEHALILSFPVLGTLLLVSVSMGLLAKAAPQMNLLMLGFPIKIGIAFLMLMLAIPLLMEGFSRLIDESFLIILEFLAEGGTG